MDDLFVDAKKATVLRSRRLQARLAIRPYDVSAVEELVDIAYAEGNEDACILAIERSFKLDLGTPARLWLMNARCYFRRWRKQGAQEGIIKLLKYFRIIMHILFRI